MIKADVSQAVAAFRDGYRDLTGAEFNQQVARALNHTARKSKTATSKAIRAKYDIKAKDIKRAIRLGYATVNNLEASITASGRSLPVRAFRHRQTKRGVSVRIMKQRKVIQKAFVTTLKSGRQAVFARGKYNAGRFNFRYRRIRPNNQNDLPITELHTTSIPQAMGRNVILNHLANQIQEDFPKRLAHLLGRKSSFGPIKQ